MANLKYKNANGEWKSLSSVRGPKGEIGPQGPKGDGADIIINGESKKEVSFYAPIDSGNENEVLISKGENLAPEWQSIPKATTIDNLEEEDYIEGNALSAHQGYILNENKVEKSTTIAGLALNNNISLSSLANAGVITNTGGSITGSLTASNTLSAPYTKSTIRLEIPKNGTAGYGLCNSDGTSIILDHGNKNVTVNATGGELYLGWTNTSQVVFGSGTAVVKPNGEIFAGNLNAGLNRDGWVYCRGLSGENSNPNIPLYHGISLGYPGKDQLDFHEYGGVFRFYRNQGSPVHLATIDAGNITFHQVGRRALLTENVSYFRHMGANTYIEMGCDGIGAYGINMWASDKRLKHDIKDTRIQALDYINKIEHKEFVYNTDEDGHITKIGYIADQLKEIDEDMIFEVGEDKIKQPKESYIIPMLSKAIQELSEKNNELEKRIEELEKQLTE